MNRPNEKGFTLIELMVVLVVLAVILKFATMSLNNNDQRRLASQLSVFKSLMQETCQTALFQNRLYGIAAEEGGMRVLTFAPMSRPKTEGSDNRAGPTRFEWRPVENSFVAWLFKPDNIQSTQPLDGPFTFEQPGWRCWPQGLVDQGAVTFRAQGRTQVLEWDVQGNFFEPNASS
ncbi:prepilin-type N-terminal cleavage/methylation domain-containing protein [Thiomicrospira sp. WB1]|uniref:prepilin-type N-terminal cleavage/methylation domain-containing protein n=1 Tax=Thiomicrospira sp. WB1 TaxID=1685380 RepID=UPI00074B12EB|nr:prepilin-type N-terminal cleavage/methylation domain-containing protein [Thiomicrospira sp. WB1]KUJ72430.1 hypothetical protein AVO41_01035 [Thiomicrospira sp. WB1]